MAVPAVEHPRPTTKSGNVSSQQTISTHCTIIILDTTTMAAEIAAGAYVATEVIEHTAEAGYAAYIVSKPTLPLKATFTRIATSSGDHSGFVLSCIPGSELR
jgi:hypothetical protein